MDPVGGNGSPDLLEVGVGKGAQIRVAQVRLHTLFRLNGILLCKVIFADSEDSAPFDERQSGQGGRWGERGKGVLTTAAKYSGSCSFQLGGQLRRSLKRKERSLDHSSLVLTVMVASEMEKLPPQVVLDLVKRFDGLLLGRVRGAKIYGFRCGLRERASTGVQDRIGSEEQGETRTALSLLQERFVSFDSPSSFLSCQNESSYNTQMLLIQKTEG